MKKWWSAPDDGGAEKSCVAHNNQQTVPETQLPSIQVIKYII
jgi:hypothetical protein